MANIVSIATAVPEYGNRQEDILQFMQMAYQLNDVEKRKLAFLYRQSGIETRYSVIPDFNLSNKKSEFFSNIEMGFPTLEKKMKLYKQKALPLSLKAIDACLKGVASPASITHLITVSCTGMSAPGLDLEIVEALDLSPNIFRTSVNFMGCYAAVHALKIGKMICDADKDAVVLIVDTELCTLHFQTEYTPDNAASSLLFADGSAAVLMSDSIETKQKVSLESFYSSVAFKGKQDMAWELNDKGFYMTLSGYIPELIQEDIASQVNKALIKNNVVKNNITHWCIHPGGKRIVDVIQKQLELTDAELKPSRDVLASYGNMSSPTILFILKQMMDDLKDNPEKANIFGMAFGPGLTMETFMASSK